MIMILTGKCKGDFEKWSREVYDNDGIDNFGKRLFYISSLDDYKFIETDHYIYNIGNSMLNALIIEFFDSFGIWKNIINDILILDAKYFNKDSWENNIKLLIITANEIYNENKA